MYAWISFVFLVSIVQGQDLAWLGGSRMSDKLSVPGMPGGRSGTGVWQDNNGSVWMFGGDGMTSSATTEGGSVMLNDLWHFALSNQTWRQLHPGTVSNLTVAASRTPQIPRPRQLPSVCGTSRVVVVFGGLAEKDEALGDLWIFDTGKKVWRMLVESYSARTRNETGENADTVSRDIGPSPRGDSAHWCTGSHLYIFGGTNASSHIFTDMWRLRLSDFTWEEMKSSQNAPASLRDRQTADYPQGRNGAMTWLSESESDSSTKLYMFGGNVLSKYPRDRHIALGFTSDLWEYTVSTDSWHYVTGNTQPGQPAVYGRKGEMGHGSVPGCRRGGATWSDVKGMLWLFGGEGADEETPSNVRSAKLLSDLWRFHPTMGEWEWMGGSKKGDAVAVFKRKGRLSHTALPGGRLDAAAWREPNGEGLFLFGGLGHDGMQHDGYLSDLWFIDISATITYHFYVPAVYGFAVIFVAMALVLCLSVSALYARDRSNPSAWRRGATNNRYSQLHDSDT